MMKTLAKSIKKYHKKEKYLLPIIHGNPPLRPLKFTDVKKIKKQIDDYFNSISYNEAQYFDKKTHIQIINPLEATSSNIINNNINDKDNSKDISNNTTIDTLLASKYDVRYKRIWISSPTMISLANYIGCNYKTLKAVADQNHIGHPYMSAELSQALAEAVLHAEQICHDYLVDCAINNKSSQGPVFLLKNNHGYTDTQVVQQSHTIQDDRLDLSQLSEEELRQLLSLQRKAIPVQQQQAPIGLLQHIPDKGISEANIS